LAQPAVRGWLAMVTLPLLSMFLPNFSVGAEFELSKDMPVVTPFAQMEVFEDPSSRMGVEEVRAEAAAGRFSPISGSRTSFGITRAAWWIRSAAHNPTDEPITWVFNVAYSQTDTVDIYEFRDTQPVNSWSLGDKRAPSARPLPGGGYAVPITTPPGETTTLYARLHNRLGDGLEAFTEVSSVPAFERRQQEIALFLGFVLGGGVILWLYNAVVFVVVRDRLYFWYLLYLGFTLATIVAITGIGTRFCWTHEGTWSEAALPLFSSLSLLFVVQFSRSFLDTREQVPVLDRVLQGVLIYFLLPPIAFYLGSSVLAAYMVMIGCVALVLLPVLGVMLWMRGHKAAPIFTLGWGIWSVSIALLALRVLGVVPSNDFTLRIAWVGILAEAVVFALALANRIRGLQSEKIAAEAREREVLARSKEQLEATVAERTKELEEANRVKDRFFSIIAHDLKSPLSGVLGLSEILKTEAPDMTPTELQEALDDLNASTVNLHKLVENLLAWAMLQQGRLVCTPEAVNLDALLRESLEVSEQAAREKGITVETAGLSGISVTADRSMLGTVLRNLVSNAIKFSRPHETVAINIRPAGTDVEISVSDHGIGMTPEKQRALLRTETVTSSSGTAGEQGTGLGLRLCRELLELQGSTLQVESEVGQGSRFWFTLPQAK